MSVVIFQDFFAPIALPLLPEFIPNYYGRHLLIGALDFYLKSLFIFSMALGIVSIGGSSVALIIALL